MWGLKKKTLKQKVMRKKLVENFVNFTRQLARRNPIIGLFNAPSSTLSLFAVSIVIIKIFNHDNFSHARSIFDLNFVTQTSLLGNFVYLYKPNFCRQNLNYKST